MSTRCRLTFNVTLDGRTDPLDQHAQVASIANVAEDVLTTECRMIDVETHVHRLHGNVWQVAVMWTAGNEPEGPGAARAVLATVPTSFPRDAERLMIGWPPLTPRVNVPIWPVGADA